jgi:rare lipoprotein A
MERLNRVRQAMISLALIIAVVLICGLAAKVANAEEGFATIYSDSFQGKKMSNGEPYDKDKLTASHKKYPFGSNVKVTSAANGRSIVLKVTDRMSQKNPAVIEITPRAASELGLAKTGKPKVKLEKEQ